MLIPFFPTFTLSTNPPLVQTQPDPKNLAFEAKLKSVAIFRDGYGYFVRRGTLKLENGWATTSFVPKAIQGTLWIYSLDSGDRVDTVISTHDNKIEFKSAHDIKGVLSDKIGLDLTITTHSGQQFSGNLNRLLDDMLLLQNGSGFNAVPYDQIKEITLNGYPLRVHVATANPNKKAEIGIAYLQEGISWTPSYVLNLTGNRGMLSLRASLKNTTEALDNVDVQFVVGSPFVSDRGIDDILALLPADSDETNQKQDASKKAPAAESILSQGTGTGQMVIDPTHPNTGGMQNGYHSAVTGTEAGELFYYRKDGLTLDPNDIAMVSIFNQSITVDPEFSWDADGDQVNYLLSFKNSSSQPYTTGSVFVVEDGHPLGEDTMKYTPSGSDAMLRLSQGIGLHVTKTETEIHRSGASQIGKATFISLTLKGVLTIENHRKESATVTVTKTVQGKVGTLTGGGIVTDTKILNGEPNPINSLKWKIDVPAGGTKVVTYEVTTYVTASVAGSPPVPSTPDGSD